MKKRAIELRLLDRIQIAVIPWGQMIFKVTSLSYSTAFQPKVQIGGEEDGTPIIHTSFFMLPDAEVEVLE